MQQDRTPLHYAAIKDYVEIVRLLLDKGADMEAQENVRAEGGLLFRGMGGVTVR